MFRKQKILAPRGPSKWYSNHKVPGLMPRCIFPPQHLCPEEKEKVFTIQSFPPTLAKGSIYFGLPRWFCSKESACNAGDTGDAGSIPVWERSPGGEHDNPLQPSCLENSLDKGVWQATVHRVTKSWTQLKWPSVHACIHLFCLAPKISFELRIYEKIKTTTTWKPLIKH